MRQRDDGEWHGEILELSTAFKLGPNAKYNVLVRVLGSSETPNDPFSRSQSTPEAHNEPREPRKPKEAARRTELWHI